MRGSKKSSDVIANLKAVSDQVTRLEFLLSSLSGEAAGLLDIEVDYRAGAMTIVDGKLAYKAGKFRNAPSNREMARWQATLKLMRECAAAGVARIQRRGGSGSLLDQEFATSKWHLARLCAEVAICFEPNILRASTTGKYADMVRLVHDFAFGGTSDEPGQSLDRQIKLTGKLYGEAARIAAPGEHARALAAVRKKMDREHGTLVLGMATDGATGILQSFIG